MRVQFELDRLYFRMNARGALVGRVRGPAADRRSRDRLPSRELLREKIAKARVEQLLAAGPEEACRIYEFVREPWRTVFLGPKPKDIEGVTRLIALNLDWYLEPPRQLFRHEWSLGLGALAGLIIALASSVSLLALHAYPATVPVWVGGFVTPYVAVLVLGLAALFAQDYERHERHIGELRNYLREVFRDVPEEDSS